MLTVKSRPVQPAQPKSNPNLSTSERRLESSRASVDEIRPLAYKNWQLAGCPVSDGVEFWLAAEMEIAQGGRR